MTQRTTIYLDMSLGQSLLIGDTRVSLVKKHGQAAHLRIEAPPSVRIRRPEPSNTSALECASSPEQGKEHIHGQHPV